MKKIAADRNYRILKRAQSIQDAIDADVEYQQFLRDTETCLSMSWGLDRGLPNESFTACHQTIEEEFAFRYGQRPSSKDYSVKDYSFYLANDFAAFLRLLGIHATANAYMKIDFEADLKEAGHSNE